MNIKYENLDSDLYKQVIKDVILKNKFKTCLSEEDIRKRTELEIDKIFKKCFFKKEDDLFFNSEVRVSTGFIDSKYKNVIIEYKDYGLLNSDNKKELHSSQLIKYFKSEELKDKHIYGFLFDGKTLLSYESYNSQVIFHEDFSGNFSFKTLDFLIRTILNSQFKEIKPENLTEDFAVLNKREYNVSRNLFKKLCDMKMKSTNERTYLLFSEWEKIFKLSESDKGQNQDIVDRRKVLSDLTGFEINTALKEYNVLFSLHTTFAIILKLIAVKIAQEFEFNSKKISFNDIFDLNINDMKDFFKKVENGDIFKSFGVMNMVEGDFFSWYTKEHWDEDLVSILKELLLDIGKYENMKIRKNRNVEDLFRDLYENCIPREIRHSFGEYYTPYWLADNVIRESLDFIDDKYNFRGLDPCCGSGTFIMRMIELVLKHFEELEDKTGEKFSNEYKLNSIIERIKGIDLNPLAVLSAKINYFINIYHLYDYSMNIEIPVYLGDATYTPSIEYIDGVKCLSYELMTSIEEVSKDIHLTLPYSLIEDKNFIILMDDLEDLIVRKNKKDAIKLLKSKINTNDLNEELNLRIENLIDKLIYLEEQNLNSIWLRIFANYLKTNAIGKFDIITGNPPWVDWKVLPERYREKVKSKCKLDGLFSTDSNSGGVSLNICALIANKASERWLKKDGVLSFLMPKTLLFNKSCEGFRNFEIYLDDNTKTRLYLNKITDWEKAGKPFNPVTEPFCTFFYKHNTMDYSKGIPVVTMVKKDKVNLDNNNTNFDIEKSKFDIVENVAVVFSQSLNNNFTFIPDYNYVKKINSFIGNNSYNFRKGVGATPTHIYRLEFVENIDRNIAKFRLFEKKGKAVRLSNNTINLEKKYIKPLIISPDIKGFTHNFENLYIIYPYTEGSKQPVPFKLLKEECPLLARYLKNNSGLLSSSSSYNSRIQNTNEFYGLIRVGKYSYGENFVAIRDNSKMICSVIQDIKTHWGDIVTPVLDGHISYISMKNNDKEFITEDESFFIAGILNLPIVKFFVENSTDSRSIGTKFDIKLPLYDESNERHKKIASLSKEIYLDKSKENDLMLEIEYEYLNM